MSTSLILNTAILEFDANDNLIKFGNNDFEIYLKSIEELVHWEAEKQEILTWHIFLKFNKENKDPTRDISHKFLNQTGDFSNKKNISEQLNNLYLNFESEILNKNPNIINKKLNPKIWAQYEELVPYKNF